MSDFSNYFGGDMEGGEMFGGRVYKRRAPARRAVHARGEGMMMDYGGARYRGVPSGCKVQFEKKRKPVISASGKKYYARVPMLDADGYIVTSCPSVRGRPYKKSDPSRKKRKLSNYNLFVKSKMPIFRRDFPDTPVRQLFSYIAADWSGMSANEKRDYDLHLAKTLSRSAVKRVRNYNKKKRTVK